jgi:aspartyl protease family protein
MPGPWENLPDLVKPSPPRVARTASRLGLWLWLGAIVGLAALLFLLNRLFPGSLGGGGTANLVQGVGWFALVSSGLLFVRQVNLKRAARNLLMWVGVFGVVLLGYAYRDGLAAIAARLQGQLLPGTPMATGAGELTIAEDESGGYQAIGSVNGARVRFLVDTGASDIVLTATDARAAGIDPDALDYSRPYATANGIAHGATTTVQELKVGAIVFNDVQVSVQREGLGQSLLGMSFLRRLKSFGFGDHRLVLRW